MNAFGLWFGTGLEHILDLNGYDHILFVVLLVFSYSPGEWKKLLILVTAFTVGHSFSLALSVVQQLKLSVAFVELSIALSILAAAVLCLIGPKHTKPSVTYLVTLLFGLLHGLGFSFLLRSMLSAENEILLPLLYFNLGIEVGQVIIVAAVTLISLFLARIKFNFYRYFKLLTVWLITLTALKISADRLLLLFA